MFINISVFVVEDEVPETKSSDIQSEAYERLNRDVPVVSSRVALPSSDVIRASDDVNSESESDGDTGSSSTDVDDLTFDLEESPGEIVHDWGEVAGGGEVPHADDTSHRLAVCNMDWDRISANDIFGEFP